MSDEKPFPAEEALAYLEDRCSALSDVSPRAFTTIRQELAALRAEVGELKKELQFESMPDWVKEDERRKTLSSPAPEQPQEDEGTKLTLVDNPNAPHWILNGPSAGKVVFPSQQPQAEPDGWCPCSSEGEMLKHLYNRSELLAWSDLVGINARSSEPAQVVEATRRVVADGWRVVPVKLLKVEG